MAACAVVECGSLGQYCILLGPASTLWLIVHAISSLQHCPEKILRKLGIGSSFKVEYVSFLFYPGVRQPSFGDGGATVLGSPCPPERGRRWPQQR